MSDGTSVPCENSTRPDKQHTWHFEEDDSVFLVCYFCGEQINVLTGHRTTPDKFVTNDE
jgi:hypothetical protein